MVQTRGQKQNRQLDSAQPPAKKRKTAVDAMGNSQRENTSTATANNDSLEAKLNQLVAKYGAAPLGDLIDEKWSASKVVMVHILHSLLSSTRISHNIARKTLACLVEENYHDLKALHQTSWQQRTEVLTAGGYVRYREKTATYLGDLADLMKTKYGNDASKLLPADEMGEKARETLSARVQEVKGLGSTGAGIFIGSIQHFFPNIAPFLDTRSRKTAEAIGLGDDVGLMFRALDRSAPTMAKLEVALTNVRLEKRENEFDAATH